MQVIDSAKSLDLFDFKLSGMPDVEAVLEAETMRARAVKTRARIQCRRAKSEDVLSSILPPEIEDGDAWHVLSHGDVDALSFLMHLLKMHTMDYVAFSTWCMAMNDVDQFADWLHDGQIVRLDAYVGEILPGTYPREYKALCADVAPHGGRVAVFRNHSKLFMCRSGQRAWVIESSANINTNPRTEQTVITADRGLFEHHKAYFDKVKSFNRDFDNWRPLA